MEHELVPIKKMIHEIRGQRVMLDYDLAGLYGVPTSRLNEAVKRNIKRFPGDFMFQLTNSEWENCLRSQIAISNKNRGGRRYAPFAFTEQGISMLSSVINSERAIEVNINIMRAFIKLRHYTLSQSATNEQMAELRKFLMLHIENNDYKFSEYDETIRKIVDALNNLIEQPPKTNTIGFKA